MMLRSGQGLILSVMLVLLLFTPALATTQADNDSLSKGLDLLVKFFMLAIVIEVAFSTIFQWKIYLKYFHNRGLKTPIVVATAFIFCKTADLNIVGQLVTVLFGSGHTINSTIGLFLTALLLAGGSSGMNTLFSKLKIRDPEAVQQRAEILQSEVKQKKGAFNATTEGDWKWKQRR